MRFIFRKPTSLFSKFKPNDLLVLVPSVFIYLFITLRNITGSSIWFDEGFGVYMSRFDFFEIAKYTAADVHPPLYYWTLKIWTFVFGVSEYSVRSLSVFFGALALILIYFIVKDLFSKKAATFAVFLTSISPMLVRYGEEARMYTMVLAVALLGTWLFLKALKFNNKKYWTYYGIVVGVGLWIHYFVALVWIIHWIFLVTNQFRDISKLKIIKNNIFSLDSYRPYFLALIVFLPWLPFMIFQLGVVQGGGFWIGQVGLYSFTNYLTETFYYNDQALTLSWMALLIVLIILFSYYFYKNSYRYFNNDKQTSTKLFVAMALITPALLFVLSLPPLRSAFVERYLLTAAMFVPISIGILIAEAKTSNGKKYFMLGLVSLVSVIGVSNVYHFGNYNKNTHFEILSRHIYNETIKRSEDGVPVIASSPWMYYETFIYSTVRNPIYFVDKDTSYEYGSLHMLRDTKLAKINDIQEFIKNNNRFWYIGVSDNELEAPYDNICKIDSFTLEGRIDRKKIYQGVEYQYCSNSN